MLMDVKIRIYDRIRKSETHEIVTVDADSGDAAAEAAQALRPGGNVVGVAPRGGLSPVGGTVMEGDDDVPQPDDEDSEPGPSMRELAMMRPQVARDLGGQSLADMSRAQAEAVLGAPVKRGPGRPRKEPL